MHENPRHRQAGFIGSAVVRHLIGHTDHEVLVVDKLTYAGNLASLASVQDHPRYDFIRSDISDRSAIADVFSSFDPDAVMHLAAESHVDRSIDGPTEFINTNVVGTYVLLEAALAHWHRLGPRAERFRRPGDIMSEHRATSSGSAYLLR